MARLLRHCLLRFNEQGTPMDRLELLGITGVLEHVVPAILRTQYPSWDDSLDGHKLARADVLTADSIRFVGFAQLIKSQRWVATVVLIELAPSSELFSRMTCKLGERDSAGSMRVHKCPDDELNRLEADWESLEWVFEATHDYGPTGLFFEWPADRMPQ